MIYLTGDTHGEFHRFAIWAFPVQLETTKDDYVIILGDFGGVWDYRGENATEKFWLDWLEDKPFTTLFLDGNHECFDRLCQYPCIDFAGGKAHQIRPHVLHLMRGEVFTLQDMKFFVFGGASSHDIRDGILDPVKDQEKIKQWSKDPNKMFRVIGQSWWPEELPSEEEIKNGRNNLSKHDYKVDYILSHSPSTLLLKIMDGGSGIFQGDRLSDYLDQVRNVTDFKQHFFGHMHVNEKYYWEKGTCLYEQILRIV